MHKKQSFHSARALSFLSNAIRIKECAHHIPKIQESDIRIIGEQYVRLFFYLDRHLRVFPNRASDKI